MGDIVAAVLTVLEGAGVWIYLLTSAVAIAALATTTLVYQRTTRRDN
jgi:hypothetical protein